MRDIRTPANWTRPNLLGLRVMIDTHLIDKGGDAGHLLRELRDAGWLQLHLADTALTEVTSASDPEKVERLLSQIDSVPISLGPMVLDHSLLGFGVLASDHDEVRLHTLHELIWHRTWDEDSDPLRRTARTRVRDTMHIANAIRYSFDSFVTHDQKLIDAAPRIAAAHPKLRVLSPPAAVAWLQGEVLLHRKRWRRLGYSPPLPAWP